MATIHPQTAASWQRAIALREARRTGELPELLPYGYDPDSYLRTFGPAAFDALVGRKFPLPDPVGAAFKRWAAAHPKEAALRLAWPDRCDALSLVRLRQRCASGDAERDAEIAEGARARAEAERRRAELARIEAERARLVGGGGDAGDVVERARAYLLRIDGESSASAWKACVALVRGFALDEGTALGLLATDYAPRFHRGLPRAELVGMVRRATRATRTGYGWLLERRAG